MLNNSIKSQRGVGLVEVLVAMVLLAIGILGFVALQVQATNATTEALKRSDAMVMLQGLAERMRLNPQGSYLNNSTSLKNCLASVCNPNEQAKSDLDFYQKQAAAQHMTLATLICPLTSTAQPRTCLLAAWDKTSATQGANQDSDCLTASGTYHAKASCLLMEAY